MSEGKKRFFCLVVSFFLLFLRRQVDADVGQHLPLLDVEVRREAGAEVLLVGERAQKIAQLLLQVHKVHLQHTHRHPHTHTNGLSGGRGLKRLDPLLLPLRGGSR